MPRSQSHRRSALVVARRLSGARRPKAWLVRARFGTAIVSLVIGWVGVVRADNLAVTVSQFGTPNSGSNHVNGWSFTPTVNIDVTQLGVLDLSNGTGSGFPTLGNGLEDSHPVGIWSSTNTTTPLVSTTIPAGQAGSLLGDIRYEPVTPTLLVANTEYIIAAFYATAHDWVDFNGGNGNLMTTDPLITPGYYQWAPSTGLTYPTNIDSADNVNLGPTFQFTTVVPEPATFTLLAVGALGLAAYTWRKRSSALAVLYWRL